MAIPWARVRAIDHGGGVGDDGDARLQPPDELEGNQ